MENLDKQCYAYPQQCKYPVHTKQAALDSYAKYIEQGQQLPAAIRVDIQQKFQKAASVHGITLEKPAPYTVHKKIASIQCGNTTVKLSIPQNTKDVLQLALNIQDMADNKGYKSKQLRNLAKTAVQWASQLQSDQNTTEALFQLPVMQKLAKIAGMGLGNGENICQQFLKRAEFIEFDNNSRKFFASVYNDVKNMPKQQFLKSATLNTLCDTLQSMDQRFDLKKYYGKQLKQPRQVCFQQTVAQLCKKASDSVVVGSTGTILSKKALQQRYQKAKSYFQHHFQQTISNFQELLQKTAKLGANYVNSFLEYLDK